MTEVNALLLMMSILFSAGITTAMIEEAIDRNTEATVHAACIQVGGELVHNEQGEALCFVAKGE